MCIIIKIVFPTQKKISLCLDEVVMEINIMITQSRGPKVRGDNSLMRQGFSMSCRSGKLVIEYF